MRITGVGAALALALVPLSAPGSFALPCPHQGGHGSPEEHVLFDAGPPMHISADEGEDHAPPCTCAGQCPSVVGSATPGAAPRVVLAIAALPSHGAFTAPERTLARRTAYLLPWANAPPRL